MSGLATFLLITQACTEPFQAYLSACHAANWCVAEHFISEDPVVSGAMLPTFQRCMLAGGHHPHPPHATPSTNETFLRGIALTAVNGMAQFQTVIPGWYPGRAVHIHVKVSIHVPVVTQMT